ncbi:hypothetical protein E4U09_008074, partial [Claviceps aff. purpurea]
MATRQNKIALEANFALPGGPEREARKLEFCTKMRLYLIEHCQDAQIVNHEYDPWQTKYRARQGPYK